MADRVRRGRGRGSRRFFSLRGKLLLSDAASLVIPLAVFGLVTNMLFSRILLDKVSKSNTDMLIQLGNHIDTTISDISSISLLIVMQSEVGEMGRLGVGAQTAEARAREKRLADLLTYLKTSKTYISSIRLEYLDGAMVGDPTGGFSAAEKEMLSAVNGRGQWLIKEDHAQIPGQSLTYGRCIKDFKNLVKQIGYLEICVDEAVFTDIYLRGQNAFGGAFYLLDRGHNVLSSTDKTALGRPPEGLALDYDRIARQAKGYYFQELDGVDYLVSFYKTQREDWLIVNLVDAGRLLEETRLLRTITVCGVLAAILICMVAVSYFSNRVLGPLRQLQEGMRSFEEGNFDARIPTTGNDELTEIGESFNRMVERLKGTMEKLYVSKLSQKKSELSMLQAQINPHFLYNTLDTIYWISKGEGAEEGARLIKALSVLFRISLNNGKQLCTVAEEVEFVSNYFTIQSKRYENVVGFTLEVQEELLDCAVVSMVLQPLIENAINHGMRETRRGGRITITIREEQSLLVYRVTDNGIGTDEERVRRILADEDGNEGFGLRNVNQRLQLHWGVGYGLAFHSRPGEGTAVTVTQPIVREGEQGWD